MKKVSITVLLTVFSVLFCEAQSIRDAVERQKQQEASKQQSRQNVPNRGNSYEPEMVFVEGGTFSMGSVIGIGDNDERPAHQVTVSSFHIGKYEITQRQWVAVMGSNPSYFKGDNLPVENVSWDDVHNFIKRLNSQTGKHYRLPTEAEWEYAARGGRQSKGYTYSGSNNVDAVAWYGENSSNSTRPVGGKTPNELGIYDMSGNVWEWCYDWYGAYSSTAQTNPTGPSSGSYRVGRGGSWNAGASSCCVANRGGSPPGARRHVGFRVVLP
jgi:formylglycine-generating enzyme required for sulfatase activity